MNAYFQINITMALQGILSINEVNALPVENFEWLFGNVIENCPEAAPVVAVKRPFLSCEDLKKGFDEYLEKLNFAGKLNPFQTNDSIFNKVFK